MKTLLDVYSDYGSIISFSSEAGNMLAKNVISQVPLIWKTNAATSHNIVGSLAFIDDSTYVCPVDSFYIQVEYAPIGTLFTLEIYSDLLDPPSYSYSATNTTETEVLTLIADYLTIGYFWKLVITPPSSSYIKIGRVMVGQAWQPNIGPSGDVTVSKNPFIKSERQRNGGVHIPPSINYKTNTVTYMELDKESLFALLDALSRYGSGATIYVEGLLSTSSFTFTSIYGRLIKWTEPQKSLSGNYSITLTVEETL